MTQPLNIKVDSGQARADLEALAKSLDAAGAAAGRMSTGLSSGMGKADASIKGAMGNMEKFAQVSAALSKIKVDSSGTKAIGEFARVLAQVAKTSAIDSAKMASWSRFIEMGALTSRLKMDAGAASSLASFTKAMDQASRARAIDPARMASWVKFIEIGSRASQLRIGATGAVGLTMFAQAMDNVSKSRAISNTKLKSWIDFIEVAARTQRLNFNPKTSDALNAFGNAMANLKAPSKGSITNLERMFQVLAAARRIPGAKEIARDLDMVAQAAGRAATALSRLPNTMRMGASGGNGVGRMARDLTDASRVASSATAGVNAYGRAADEAGKRSYSLGERLRGLNHRFNMSHQLGSLLSGTLGAITFGGMIKGVYDASIGLAKLEKAMLFATRSYEGAKQQTNGFIATVYDMGLALDQVAEPYGRFTISAGAAGMSAQQSADIFRSVTQTLQVVGASAEQTGYAMYGLTQMIQKGKVSSEEFNRQIGEQIPGNAEAGRRALSKLRGEAVSMKEFYDEMRKGNILSDDFTIAWAGELNAMFKDLMPLIQGRPDIALNRLKTSFTMFQQEIGKSGFMAEVGIQFNRLAEMIGKTEGGVFKLKPRFQELAEMLGRNLTRTVRMAGDALVWLADNFEKVLFAAKAIATIYLGAHLISWGKGAMSAVGGIVELTTKLLGLKAANEAVAVSEAQRTGAATKGAVGRAALTGATTADIQNWRGSRGLAPGQTGGSAMPAPAVAGFGRRGRVVNPMRMGPAAAGAGGNALVSGMRGAATTAARPSMMAGAGSAAAAGAGPAALRALSVAAMALGPLFAILGGAAVATAGTLTILSDKATKVGGQDVEFGDILAGAMSRIGQKLGDYIPGLLKRIFKVESTEQAFQKLGDVMMATVNAIEWMGEMIFDTINSVVMAGMAIAGVVSAVSKASRGDFLGAGKDLEGAASDFKAAGSGWGDNFDLDARIARSLADTIDQANARRMADEVNMDSEQAQREAARRLAAQKAADDQLKAALLQKEAAEQMTKAIELPTVNSVMDGIRALADGSYAAANPIRTPAARTAAGNAVTAALTGADGAASTASAAPAVAAAAAAAAQITYRMNDGTTLLAKTQREMEIRIFNQLQTLRPEAERYRHGGSANAGITADRATASAAARQATTTYLDERDARRAATAPGGGRSGALAIAGRYLGQNETNDRESIGGFLRQNGINVDPKMTAWCAAFVNAVLATNGQTGTGSNRARSFMNYGEAVETSEAKAGDIAVFSRGSNQQQGHVGFFQGFDERGNVRVLGGNQGRNGAVSETTMSRSSLLGIRRAPGNGAGSPGAAAAAGAAPEEYSGTPLEDDAQQQKDRDIEKRKNAWKSLQSVLALPDPASQSVARINSMVEQLDDLKNQSREMVGKYGQDANLFTPEVVDQVASAFRRLFKEASDALNPIGKANRQLRDQNDLVTKTAAGFGRQARWQEHLNELREQGYPIDLMQDEVRWQEHINRLQSTGMMVQADSLEVSRQQWELEQDRTEALAAQVNLLEAANEARLRGISRNGSPRDAYFAELVNSTVEGGTYDEKLATVSLNKPRLEALNAQADIQMMSDRADALRNLRLEADDLVATATMTAAQAAYDQSYYEALRQITGLTGATRAVLTEEAEEADKALANGFAKLREELENQPGFAKWADGLEPLAKRMEDIKGQFMDGLSDGITDTIMGEDVDWQAMFKNIRRAQVKAGVDSALASVSNFLSGRKPGEAVLSPEARAAADALASAQTVTERQITATTESVSALLKAQDANADTARAAREAADTLAENMPEIVRSLTTAADALASIAGTPTTADAVTFGGALSPEEEAMQARQVAQNPDLHTPSTAESIFDENGNRRITRPQDITLGAPLDAEEEAMHARQRAQNPADYAPTWTLPTAGENGWFGGVDQSWMNQAQATPYGDGFDATADVAARLAARSTTDATADVAARLAARPTLDGAVEVLQPASIPSLTELGAPTLPAPVSAIPSMRLPTQRVIQASLPQASPLLNREVDERNLGQQLGSVIFKDAGITGGMETDVRNSTASAMGTAVTQGPMAGFSADGEDGGMSSAAEAIYQAAGALASMAPPFNEATTAYVGAIEKFAEVVKKLDEVADKLAKGGGGGGAAGGGPPSGMGLDGNPIIGGSANDPIGDLWGLYADGGFVSGSGGPTSDSINARLSNGEFVINAKATAQNRDLLEAINTGKAYASGGLVDGLPGFAGGGWFSGLSGALGDFGSRFKPTNVKNHFFGEGGQDLSAKQMGSRAFSGVFGKGQNGKYDGPLSGIGAMFGKGNSMETRATGGFNLLSSIGTMAELFAKQPKPEVDPAAVKGVIGEHRGVTVDATEVAAHQNPWAMAIDMGMDMLTGGSWGKTKAFGQMAMGSIDSIGKLFAEGGYVSSAGASGMDWSSAPHYKEGTANTSGGGMPAVVHPNEAVIPLSGGRTVPVDMSGLDMAGTSANVTSNITIIAPNPDAFRKSQGSIQRTQNRDMRRSANRNLTA